MEEENFLHKGATKTPDYEVYFMGIAVMVSKKSQDPSSKVGAVIVNKDLHIVSSGFNDFPVDVRNTKYGYAYIKDTEVTWIESKYPYITHAEASAILHASTVDLTDCTIYITMHPCHECARMIVEKGIKKVVYMNDKYHDKESYVAARDLFRRANVNVKKIDEFDIEIKYK